MPFAPSFAMIPSTSVAYNSGLGNSPVYLNPETRQWVSISAISEFAAFFSPLVSIGTAFQGNFGYACGGVQYWSSTAIAVPGDHWAEQEVDANHLGPAVRVSATEDSCYYLDRYLDTNDYYGRVILYKRAAGVETALHSSYSYDAFSTAVGSLKLKARGAVLEVWGRFGPDAGGCGYDPLEQLIATYPWTLIYTVTDPSPLAGGRPGQVSATTWRNGELTTHWSWGVDLTISHSDEGGGVHRFSGTRAPGTTITPGVT